MKVGLGFAPVAVADKQSRVGAALGSDSRRFPLGGAILWILSLLVGAGNLRAGENTAFEVQLKQVDLLISADAVVEAVNQATVAAQVAGRVLELRVDAGQRVSRGQLLLRIDSQEAKETAVAASTQAKHAKIQLERTQALVSQKFLSPAALDKAKADFDAASAQAAGAGASAGHGLVTAPIAGVVARRLVEPGEMASPGRPLVSLYDPASLRLTAAIPQYQLAKLRGANEARVEFTELGRWVNANSLQLLPGADAATHVAQIRVGLPGGLRDMVPGVLPGMAAKVHFLTGKAMRLAVPASAILRRGEVNAVYVQDGGGRWLMRQVRVGEVVGGGEVEIRAGLKPGEKIALQAQETAMALAQVRAEKRDPQQSGK